MTDKPRGEPAAPAEPEEVDEDELAILARRRAFIASALAGLSLAVSDCALVSEREANAQPCLSVVYVPPDAAVAVPRPCLAPPPYYPPDAAVARPRPCLSRAIPQVAPDASVAHPDASLFPPGVHPGQGNVRPVACLSRVMPRAPHGQPERDSFPMACLSLAPSRPEKPGDDEGEGEG